jgi:hypothetical protein
VVVEAPGAGTGAVLLAVKPSRCWPDCAPYYVDGPASLWSGHFCFPVVATSAARRPAVASGDDSTGPGMVSAV